MSWPWGSGQERPPTWPGVINSTASNGSVGVVTLGDNPSLYSLRMGSAAAAGNQTANMILRSSGGFNTVTLTSGGLLFANVNNVADTTTVSQVIEPTVNFGTAGAAEALIYASTAFANTNRTSNNFIVGNVAATGLTKFGAGAVTLFGANPSLNGTITINATDYQHQLIQKHLDSVTSAIQRQVLIEATIVEVVLSDAFQAGIDWSRIPLTGSGGLSITQTLLGGFSGAATGAGATAGGGASARPNTKRRGIVSGGRVGSVSQAGRNAQAARDGRGG